MCERFSLTTDYPELAKQFRIDKLLTFYKPRYNVAPTQSIQAVVASGEERWLDEFRWGLVPFWGKDAVNADSATMDEKRAYRRIYTTNRCVIPCDGFYAWKPGEDGKPGQPMRIVPTNRRVFGMAGIYEVWLSPGSRDVLRTCTVLTTGANRLVAPMSERMPVLLDEAGIDQWLDMKLTDKIRLRYLLRPAPVDMLRAYPVSPRVNSTDHEEPDCIEELDLRLPLAKA